MCGPHLRPATRVHQTALFQNLGGRGQQAEGGIAGGSRIVAAASRLLGASTHPTPSAHPGQGCHQEHLHLALRPQPCSPAGGWG